ncbi:hypothetical protein ACVDG5_004610 [Mesorhizobium sp. ORM6]
MVTHRHGSGSISALVFAAGAVALWSTNALVGKSLLANHPVSQVQFLQFAGAALAFALIRFMSRGELRRSRPGPLWHLSRSASSDWSAPWCCNTLPSLRCR